ncbi:MAG: response regulator [Chitinivibrionales bacterium]|nr:response regulator [Chitinivibrionales bacterium]MBD3358343.1 response regulator [Chitinivibrionales bacterium]
MKPSPSVLIVEDEAAMVLALQLRLKAGGFSVCGIASSKDEAVSLATEHLPDFVIMDIRLSGEGDGIDAAREIADGLGTNVIFTTGYAEEDVRKRAMEVEPLAFLVKPFRIAELITIMNRHRESPEKLPNSKK